MKYMLLVCWDAERMNAQDEPEQPVSGDESFPWLDDVQARGIWMTGDQLAPTRRARTVRVRDGKKLVTDGPFVETKEALGGYLIFEADDLDAAIELAASIPAASMGGAIEVRPVVEW